MLVLTANFDAFSESILNEFVWLNCFDRYTLLVGHPPFETQSLKDTYSKIKRNEYHIPSRIGPLARTLISRMLQADPLSRYDYSISSKSIYFLLLMTSNSPVTDY